MLLALLLHIRMNNLNLLLQKLLEIEAKEEWIIITSLLLKETSLYRRTFCEPIKFSEKHLLPHHVFCFLRYYYAKCKVSCSEWKTGWENFILSLPLSSSDIVADLNNCQIESTIVGNCYRYCKSTLDEEQL